MTISPQQIEAARRGEPVRLVTDGVEVVLLRADLFQELEAARDDVRETYPAILRAWDADDVGDPDQEYRDA